MEVMMTCYPQVVGMGIRLDQGNNKTKKDTSMINMARVLTMIGLRNNKPTFKIVYHLAVSTWYPFFGWLMGKVRGYVMFKCDRDTDIRVHGRLAWLCDS